MLDDNDIKMIRSLIDTSLTTWDLTRRERMRMEAAERDKVERPMVTKLYLISLGGNHVAFPDERGRAIFTQAIYARLTRREDDTYVTSCMAEVVAYGDGQRLEKPLSMILTGLSVIGLVEVPESLLNKTA